MRLPRHVLVLTLMVSLFLFANRGTAESQTSDDNNSDSPAIIVSSKDYTENLILGKIMVLLLQEAGLNVDDQTGYAAAEVRAALERGEIHLYPELAGTALALYHNLPTDALPTERDRSHALAKQMDGEQGIVWLAPTNYVLNTAMAVRPDLWAGGLRSISDLADYMNASDAGLRLCMIDILLDRPHDGLKALEETYGFSFQTANVRSMPVSDTLLGLRADECDVAVTINTDGRIVVWDYHVLADDLTFYPQYVPAPTIREQALAENPLVAEVLADFGQHLTLEAITALNARVDIGADGIVDSGDEETPEAVALSFLRSVGLLETPAIIVSSKDYTENLILGKIMVLLLQEAGLNVDDQTGYAAAEVRAALERGEIHLYPELAGTALALYHNLPTDALPTERDRSHALAKQMDGEQGIVWLAPTNYVLNTAMAVRPDLWAGGLRSISDLADYMNASDAGLRLCMIDILLDRPHDGLKALEETYGFSFQTANVRSMPVSDTLLGLRADECDVAVTINTDGRIVVWDYHVLADDLTFYPQYVPAPTIREQALAENPLVAEVLADFGQHLTLEAITALNARVDIGADGIVDSGDEETPEAVALSFLRSVGLLETPAIIVSSKDYTENLILGKIMVLLLQEAGLNVDDQTGYAAAEVRAALERGEIHLYPELAGTALALYHNLPTDALPTERDRSHALAKQMDGEQGIVWLAPTNYVLNTAMAVRPDLWAGGLRSISDLADYMNASDAGLRLCMIDILLDRPHDGLKALEETYGFSFQTANVRSMPVSDTLQGLRADECDVAATTSTDGRIVVWDYHVLADDLTFYPQYVPAPTIREQALAENPLVAEVLADFGQHLTLEAITALNARVDIGADGIVDSGDEETPEAVALSFLRSVGLLETPAIVVSSKDYTEQRLLGEILLQLLKAADYNVEDKTGLNAGEIRMAMENGEIDLYFEFTGTALSAYHKLPTSTLPTDRDRSYKLAKRMDEPQGIAWLPRSNHINSFATVVSPELVAQNMTTLDELADYMDTHGAELGLCVADVFYNREQDGLAGLEEAYGFTFHAENITVVSIDGAYEGLRDGRCDVAVGGLTDGRISAWDLTVLQDTRSFLPVYVAAPVIRQAVLTVHPQLADVLSKLTQQLGEGTMTVLNARVDIGADGIFDSGDEEVVEDVAREFLESVGLLESVAQANDGVETAPSTLNSSDN